MRPPDAAIPSAVGLQRSGDWPAARRIDRCAAPPANYRCAVGLLPLLQEEFRLLKLILHSELRRRAASRRALHCPSSLCVFLFLEGHVKPPVERDAGSNATERDEASRSTRVHCAYCKLTRELNNSVVLVQLSLSVRI